MAGVHVRVGQIVCGLLLAFVGVRFGETYIGRLSHHPGYFLVANDDAVAEPRPSRPRRAVVVVADGLGSRFARRMRSARRLEAAGQCRITDVGPISVSRPVYAVISTGLEQDRTGARNNDETAPLAVESIWEVAREAGLVVAGVSDVPWWQQLFPRGFDRYAARPEEDNYFATTELGDLTLIHASYIDHAGHAHGAASAVYAAAVERLDAELSAFLDELDLTQDLVVLTADHGHSRSGGHGGRAPEIAEVWTCFAGRGVARLGEGSAIHAHAIAGALAVLLGLRFPRHMRAGDDDLDALFEVAAAGAFAAEYLAGRREAVARARAINAEARAGWLGGAGSWIDLYAQERRRQRLRGAIVGAAVATLFAVAARRRRLGAAGGLRLAVWCAAVMAAAAVMHVVWLGSFDWTAINLRERYLRAAPLVCAIAVAPAIAWSLWREGRARLAGDLLTLSLLGLAVNVGHVVVFGWPLGFPLPGPAALLLPFFAAFFTVVHGLLAALAAGWALWRGRGVVGAAGRG
ncbi:MAG: alkaline phosphatase family protein [Myxococcales bacterium]|nr:alkaline phosphatase family protein [Myxococcales bacterium]